jgi:hypothetical protein
MNFLVSVMSIIGTWAVGLHVYGNAMVLSPILFSTLVSLTHMAGWRKRRITNASIPLKMMIQLESQRLWMCSITRKSPMADEKPSSMGEVCLWSFHSNL